MEQAKIFTLVDLIEDIKKVDEMISFHKNNPSDFMRIQYIERKQKLISYLIDELVEPEMRSPKSFAIILSALDKFYPNLKKEAASDASHKELSELEAVLA
jgi:hypothetical protein